MINDRFACLQVSDLCIFMQYRSRLEDCQSSNAKQMFQTLWNNLFDCAIDLQDSAFVWLLFWQRRQYQRWKKIIVVVCWQQLKLWVKEAVTMECHPIRNEMKRSISNSQTGFLWIYALSPPSIFFETIWRNSSTYQWAVQSRLPRSWCYFSRFSLIKQKYWPWRWFDILFFLIVNKFEL